MMKKNIFLSILLFTISESFGRVIVDSTRATVVSPDKNYIVTFYQVRNDDGTKTMLYHVNFKNQEVIAESVLDIQIDNNLSERAMALPVDRHAKWCDDLAVRKIVYSSVNTNWIPVYGERSVVRDQYNAVTIEMIKEDNPMYFMNVEIRAYNEGVALRYFFPENAKGTYYRVISENTEFCLPEGTKAWHASWAQAPYRLLPLKDWPDEGERPLTLQLPNGWFACLAEARMVDYARTKFKLGTGKPNTIVTSMYTPADLISPFATPWRVIMTAEKAGDLIENNDLLMNLNPLSKVKDESWIKPGKIMRVMTQTTKDAFETIDFAVKHNLQYILFDWKWYGPAFSFNTDATKVAIPDFDLPAIIKYGKERGIGVWLYCNQQGLYAQSDSLFRIYHQWGVKGVKFGFVQVGSHRWTTWLEDMFKKCAENQVMVNVHDDWRPTGEQRTWPNLLTAEGVRGNEEMPDATHNTILPFTRYIAGAADYTICYYDKRIKTTHAHQLAMAAINYSPLQTLYWYDKPAFSHDEPELEFWDRIPVSWDESRVLQGEPGQFITTARRKGEEWFMGSITNNSERTIELNFGFLPKGRRYTATIYNDDETVKTNTKVSVEKKTVTSATTMKVKLKPSGGQAVWIAPVAPDPQEIHVSKEGHDEGSGDKQHPFLTINYAAQKARPGDKVIIHAGIYREQISMSHGGTGENSRVSFAAAPGEPVIVKGSEQITSWKQENGNVWKADLPDELFGEFNPFQTVVDGQTNKHLGAVYVDGTPYAERSTRESADASSGSWFASKNGSLTTIRVNFGKLNPLKSIVEINVRPVAVTTQNAGVNYITLDRIRIAQVACNRASINGEQPGAVSTGGGIHWIIQHCEVSDAKGVAITLAQPGGHDLRRNGPNRPAFGEFENIDAVGHHIVRNNRMLRCGQAGIFALLHSTLSVIDSNYIEDVNVDNAFQPDDVGGLRLAVAVDATIRGNVIRNVNNGSGIMMGPLYQGTRITGNVITGIKGNPLYFFRSHGLALVDNNVIVGPGVATGAGIRLRGAEANVFAQNLFADCAVTSKPVPPREASGTINYLPHTLVTRQTIPATTLDNKWFRNIFIRGGLDSIGHDHGESEYNIFMGGADKSSWGDSLSKVVPGDGGFRLSCSASSVNITFNLASLPALQAPVIDARFIGRFALSQSIEWPDGRPVELISDFFGRSAPSGSAVIGPFTGYENLKAKSIKLFKGHLPKDISK